MTIIWRQPDLLTINEAAARARVNRRTIYNWLNAGKLTYVRTMGGSIRIAAASLFRTEDRAYATARTGLGDLRFPDPGLDTEQG
jgi:excisionase family DNA binding protein